MRQAIALALLSLASIALWIVLQVLAMVITQASEAGRKGCQTGAAAHPAPAVEDIKRDDWQDD